MTSSPHKQPRLRAVVDPGVLISALISRQPNTAPSGIVTSWMAGTFVPVISVKLLDELHNVLMRPKYRRYFSEQTADRFMDRLWRVAELHLDPALPRLPITADPKDDYLIALAQSANADVLVSGDQHLKVHEDVDLRVHFLEPSSRK